jgi:dipeptide transport system substrate-binding protein
MIHKCRSSFVLAMLLCVLSSPTAFAKTLNVQFSNEPTQYDPLLMEDGVGMRVVANTVGTLFEYDGKGVLSKALVQSYSLSRDRKKYTIQFRKGLKWSDGVAFKPEHFILALERFTREPIRIPISQFFPDVDLSQTKVVDDRTVQVALKAPDALFLNWCTLSALAPIRPEMIEAYKKRADPVQPTLAAYQVVEYKREEYLLLRKNPEYFNRDQVGVDEVKIRFVRDEASLVSLLRTGAVDVLFRVPVLQLEELNKFAKIENAPAEAVTYFGLNVRHPPFNERKNRIALRDALFARKDELAKTIKTDEIGANLFAPDILWPSAPPRRSPPPAPAKSNEKLVFDAQSDVSSRNQMIFEFVQNELKKSLGWSMKLEMLEWKSHYAKIKSDPEELYRFGWQNPVSDPFVTYQVFQGGSPNNFTGWSNARYDELLSQLRQETRSVKRFQLMRQLEDILWEEAPVIPMLHLVNKFAYSKRVSGFRANSFGVVLFREIRLRD